MITIDQFSAVSLVAGRILSAELVPGSDTLLYLSVDVGEPNPRTILSGIRAHYLPDDLVGLVCVVVSNLEPRTLFGVESNGMLVCVSYSDGQGGEQVRVVTLQSDVPPGSRLS